MLLLPLLIIALNLTATSVAALPSIPNPNTPLERFLKGERIQGVFDINDSQSCSAIARQKVISQYRVLADDAFVFRNSRGENLLAGRLSRTLREELLRPLTLLQRALDPAVAGKHICAGLYAATGVGQDSPNALSHPAGYVIFDHSFLRQIYTMPGISMAAHDFIVFHEFAHQLQAWNEDPAFVGFVTGKRQARVAELKADCAAATLLTLWIADHWPKEVAPSQIEGVKNVAYQIGDTNLFHPSHHGKPEERLRATQYGVVLAEALIRAGKGNQVKSGGLLQACEAAIDQPGR